VEEFRAAMEEESGADLETFFRQWPRRTGIPSFRIDWSAAPLVTGEWEVQAIVEQGKGEDPKQVRIPITLRLEGGERRDETMTVTDGRALFRWTLQARPERLIADETGCLLAAIEVRRREAGRRDRDDDQSR
jgi:aminopeptidase N